MEHTVSLKLNHEFRRLYGRGKSAVNPCLAVYCRKNNLGYSRLGLTVGVKLGKAVVRNRTRRRIKEAYRIHEGAFLPATTSWWWPGCGPPTARYRELERSLLSLADKLGLLRKGGGLIEAPASGPDPGYRTYISPSRPPCCRFLPTCSAYALEAVEDARGIAGAVSRCAGC